LCLPFFYSSLLRFVLDRCQQIHPIPSQGYKFCAIKWIYAQSSIGINSYYRSEVAGGHPVMEAELYRKEVDLVCGPSGSAADGAFRA